MKEDTTTFEAPPDGTLVGEIPEYLERDPAALIVYRRQPRCSHCGCQSYSQDENGVTCDRCGRRVVFA